MPVVGSSRNTQARAGPAARRPTLVRRRCPPESRPTRVRRAPRARARPARRRSPRRPPPPRRPGAGAGAPRSRAPRARRGADARCRPGARRPTSVSLLASGSPFTVTAPAEAWSTPASTLSMRALARAALADDRDQLARLQRQRGRMQDRLLARLAPRSRAPPCAARRASLVATIPSSSKTSRYGPMPTDGPALERRPLHQLAVHARAVARAEVDDLGPAVAHEDLGVKARDVRVAQHEVVRRVTPDRQALTLEANRSGSRWPGPRATPSACPRRPGSAPALRRPRSRRRSRAAAARSPDGSPFTAVPWREPRSDDVHPAIALLDAGMAARDLFAGHHDVALLGAAERQRLGRRSPSGGRHAAAPTAPASEESTRPN